METQESVASWGNKNFPGDTPKDKVRMLIEEASELAVTTGMLSLSEALETVKTVWNNLEHLPKSAEHIISGVADVQISLFMIADENGLLVQKCLDAKMSKNRQEKE